MEKSNPLANRVREVILNGTWIANTNFKHQLSALDWKQATHKVDSLNTIAALTFHINYYFAGILNVFEGGPLVISDKFSFDAPPINSQEDWEALQADLYSNTEKFATHVDAMSEDKLESVFIDEKYGSFRRNIEGVIEHSYYHLGQITLIGKMVKETVK